MDDDIELTDINMTQNNDINEDDIKNLAVNSVSEILINNHLDEAVKETETILETKISVNPEEVRQTILGSIGPRVNKLSRRVHTRIVKHRLMDLPDELLATIGKFLVDENNESLSGFHDANFRLQEIHKRPPFVPGGPNKKILMHNVLIMDKKLIHSNNDILDDISNVAFGFSAGMCSIALILNFVETMLVGAIYYENVQAGNKTVDCTFTDSLNVTVDDLSKIPCIPMSNRNITLNDTGTYDVVISTDRVEKIPIETYGEKYSSGISNCKKIALAIFVIGATFIIVKFLYKNFNFLRMKASRFIRGMSLFFRKRFGFLGLLISKIMRFVYLTMRLGL